MNGRKFPGKIILFGEYTVLEGYRALALPYRACYGQWIKGNHIDPRLQKWSVYLQGLCQQVEWISPDACAVFERDIQQHWQFQSNIPQGYGAGSSGAFVAAWYHRYISESALPLPILQKRLAELESHFHGKSSGLDPLVSLLEKALLVQNGRVEKVPLANFDFPAELSLYDTGIPRSTEPIVALYRQKKQTAHFVEQVLPALGRAQELAIDAYLLAEWQTVGEQMAVISQLQFHHFGEMIPSELRSTWEAGWAKGEFFKLCGAGGGGYMLKWTMDQG